MEQIDRDSFIRELCGCADCLKMTEEEEACARSLTNLLAVLKLDISGRWNYNFQDLTAQFPQLKWSPVDRKSLKISTMLSTVDMGCRLDLRRIAQTTWNVEDKLKTGHSLVMRIRRPLCTALIYKRGKITCWGTKSVSQSRVAARRFARILQKAGMPVRFLNFKINNIAAWGSTFPINVEQLALCLEDCSYKSDVVPCLHYKLAPHITATIYSTGKVKLTGCKNKAEVNKAFNNVWYILSSFRSYSRLQNRKRAKQ